MLPRKQDCSAQPAKASIQLRGGNGPEPTVSFAIATPLKSGGSNLIGIRATRRRLLRRPASRGTPRDDNRPLITESIPAKTLSG